jgi:hypothetical protein
VTEGEELTNPTFDPAEILRSSRSGVKQLRRFNRADQAHLLRFNR